jgi:hypothetical protein
MRVALIAVEKYEGPITAHKEEEQGKVLNVLSNCENSSLLPIPNFKMCFLPLASTGNIKTFL